jgi:hypothetical protein
MGTEEVNLCPLCDVARENMSREKALLYGIVTGMSFANAIDWICREHKLSAKKTMEEMIVFAEKMALAAETEGRRGHNH